MVLGAVYEPFGPIWPLVSDDRPIHAGVRQSECVSAAIVGCFPGPRVAAAGVTVTIGSTLTLAVANFVDFGDTSRRDGYSFCRRLLSGAT